MDPITEPYMLHSINIKEAAKFLGYRTTDRVTAMAKRGEIPAFRIGDKWMFYVPDLIAYVRSQYERNKELAIDPSRGKICPLVRKKTAPTGTSDLKSAASQCKNLREQLRAQRRKSTKTNVVKIYANK